MWMMSLMVEHLRTRSCDHGANAGRRSIGEFGVTAGPSRYEPNAEHNDLKFLCHRARGAGSGNTELGFCSAARTDDCDFAELQI
jgi:hypothetical protein